jgi:hypothetical protein
VWTFRQATGFIEDFTGRVCGLATSGRGEGRNNPILQDVRAGCRLSCGEWVPVEGLKPSDFGPLPQGIYTMDPPQETLAHGPYVLWLTPGAGNEMFGRSGFCIMGPPSESKVSSIDSEGCIITPRVLRERMWDSKDVNLQVIQ